MGLKGALTAISWRTAIWGAILLMGQAVAVPAAQGPLQVKNRFPLHLLFLTPRPSPVQIPEPHRVQSSLSLDYSAVFFDHRNSRWDFLIDMEMTDVVGRA